MEKDDEPASPKEIGLDALPDAKEEVTPT